MHKCFTSILLPGLVHAASTGNKPFPKPFNPSPVLAVSSKFSLNTPAVDTGSSANCPQTYQRDIPRPVGEDGDGVTRYDVGAYEAPAVTKT